MPATDDPLAQACRDLWRATFALMKAYPQAAGPAQRVLLARRIARNFHTLAAQAVRFAPGTRGAFARLARRWAGLAGWH